MGRVHYPKVRWVYLVVFTMLFYTISGINIGVRAADKIMVGGIEITNIDVAFKEMDEGEPITTGSAIVTGTSKVVSYSLHLKNDLNDPDVNLTTEPALIVKIPEVLKLEQDEKIPLKYNNIIIGECALNKSTNTGEISFNEEVRKVKEGDIGFCVGVRVDVDLKEGEEEEREIKFVIGTKIIGINLEFKGGEDNQGLLPSIKKVCNSIDEQNKTITWGITVSSGEVELKDAIIKECFETKAMKLKEITYQDKAYKNYTDFTNDDIDKESKIEIKVPSLKANESCEFKVVTTIKEALYESVANNKDLEILNKVILQYQRDNEPKEKTAQASASIRVSWIHKEVVGLVEHFKNNKYERVIAWKAIINSNKLNLAGWTFTDNLPQGTELMLDTLEIRKNNDELQKLTLYNGDYGYTYDPEAEESWKYTDKKGNDKTIKSRGTLKYNFPDREDHNTYTIYYKTKVTGSSPYTIGDMACYYNRATLGNGISTKYDFATRNIEITSIKKSGNYVVENNKHYIQWNVVMNMENKNLKELTMVDDEAKAYRLVGENKISIPSEIKYDLNSIYIEGKKIKKDPTIIDNSGVEARCSYENGKLTCTITGNINKDYTVAFKSELPSEVFGNNYLNSVENEVTVTGKDSLGMPISENRAEASVDIRNPLLRKQNVAYDYEDKVATWLIVVNEKQLKLNDVSIVDSLEKGQSYKDSKVIEGLVEYRDGKYYLNNAPVNLSNVQATHMKPKVDKSDITYNLGTIEGTYSILLTANVDTETVFKPGIQPIITNRVEMKGASLPEGILVEVEQPLQDGYIIKSGKQVNKNGPIEWQLIINHAQMNMKNIVVSDQLSQGLRLDTNSVMLYNVNVNSYGSIDETSKVPITIDANQITYDTTENKIKFNLGNLSKCCILVFKTEVMDSNTKDYINTAVIEGATTEKWQTESKKVEVHTQFSDSWGGGKEARGTIKIHKIDEEEPAKALEGVEFTLNCGNVNVVATTDSKGIATFDDLELNKVYVIRESKGLEGYFKKTDEVYHEKLITDKTQEITVTNKLIKNGVQFKKLDNHNKPLEGVEFSLSKPGLSQEIKAVSDKDGVVSFTNVPIGTYSLKEIKGIEGYKPLKDIYTVVIKENETGEVYLQDGKTIIKEIVNEQIKGSIKVLKVNEKNKPLNKASIALLDAQKTIIETRTTDEEGMAYFKEVPYGMYYIQEVKAPSGYKLNKTLYEVKVLSDAEILITVVDKKYNDDPVPSPSSSPSSSTGGGSISNTNSGGGSNKIALDNPEVGSSQGGKVPKQAELQTTTYGNMKLDEKAENLIDNGPEVSNSKVDKQINEQKNDKVKEVQVSKGNRLPKTGGLIGVGLVILSGISLCAVGGGITLRSSRKNKKK